MATSVDEAFALALPKVELHAHLSGSVGRGLLHKYWLEKRSCGQCLDMEDPLVALDQQSIDIDSFFPLFDQYIYRLLDDAQTVKAATRAVIRDFEADSVVYLELRTTPRENTMSGLTKMDYVAAVHAAIHEHEEHSTTASVNIDDMRRSIQVRLILSIDRKMTAEQADEVVDLAIAYSQPQSSPGYVVGVDLCGNPAKGDGILFTPAFRRAKAHGLRVTVHFAEIPASSTDSELATLLSWEPDRLGHVVCASQDHKDRIARRKIGLELCLSCNVLAKMSKGGFADHHFGEWRRTACPIALSVSRRMSDVCAMLMLTQTDDVGIFGSPLSNEYLFVPQCLESRTP
jgi:adenosine deaminase